jgi:hypothetical protein
MMVSGCRGAALTCALTAAAGAAIAGCGGDSEEPSTTVAERRGPSLASEPPRVFATRLAKLLETTRRRQECIALASISSRSRTKFPCPPDALTRSSMAGFEIVGVGEYGPGAIIDYRSGTAKEGAAIVLSVGVARAWAVNRFGVVTKPSTGTSDEESRDGFSAAVDAYLTAVRERDCKAFEAVTFVSQGSADKACETVLPTTRRLAKRLRVNPSAKPRYQGGNATYGFFALELPKPKPANVTISVIRDDTKSAKDEYLVLDATGSPTDAQQRRARAVAERQRENAANPKTSPSRKTSD